LLDKKRFDLIKLRERYTIGIEKLELSENQIIEMKQELTQLQPQMVKTKEETEDLIAKIEKEAGEVDAIKQIVEVDNEKANIATMEAQSIKNECEDQLDEAMPALLDAINSLKTLKTQDISRTQFFIFIFIFRKNKI
jgi:dynein heavy chain